MVLPKNFATPEEIAADQVNHDRGLEHYETCACQSAHHEAATSCGEGRNMPIAPWLKDDGCDPVPLENLIQQIVGHHNGSLRRTIPYLGALIDDLASDFRVSHPELRLLRRLFHAFVTELVLHLLKEEHVVLPLIGRYAISRKCEATAAQELLAAIAAMEREHAELATRLVTLQNLVSAVWAPDTLGQRWRTLVHGFSVLAAEAYLAIDKENNVLFPRAKRNAQDSICLER